MDTSTLALPEDVSAHGHHIDSLLALSHRFDLVLAVLMLGVLALFLWRYRGPRKVAADGGTVRSRGW